MTAVCKSCGADLIWAVTDAGRSIPLDAEPLQLEGFSGLLTGLFALVKRRDSTPFALSASPGPMLSTLRNRDVALYRSHFATCPDADRHRRS